MMRKRATTDGRTLRAGVPSVAHLFPVSPTSRPQRGRTSQQVRWKINPSPVVVKPSSLLLPDWTL
jgi:hypothetical protein